MAIVPRSINRFGVCRVAGPPPILQGASTMNQLTSRLSCLALAACCVASLAACAAPSSREDPPLYTGPLPSTSAAPAAPAAAASVAYGTVSAVESGAGVAQDAPRGTGAVVGGVIGAVIGRQVTEGSRGKNIGAAVGAGVGALIGHEIEKNVRRDRARTRVTVRLDDGGTRQFDWSDGDGGPRVGDRVRIEGDQLYRVS
jgi:outer membrane lipoprotein SlyB